MADNTPLVILGVTFDCPAPYDAGHTCNLFEARQLNQVFAENLRNNFTKRVKAVKAAQAGRAPEEIVAAMATLRVEFSAYAAQYSLGNTRGTRAQSGDPVMAEALRIAKPMVRSYYARKGLVVEGEQGEEKFADDIAKVAMQPQVQAEAQRRVDLMLKSAGEALDL